MIDNRSNPEVGLANCTKLIPPLTAKNQLDFIMFLLMLLSISIWCNACYFFESVMKR